MMTTPDAASESTREVRVSAAEWIADPHTIAEEIDAFIAAHRAYVMAHPEVVVVKPTPGAPALDWAPRRIDQGPND